MGVRLPEKPALAQCLTHSPRAGTRYLVGARKQEMPAQAPARRPVARRLSPVRDSQATKIQLTAQANVAVYELGACPRRHPRRHGQNLREDMAAQPPSPSRQRVECTPLFASNFNADASQMQSMWKGPSSPK